MKIKVDVLHNRVKVGRHCQQGFTITELRVLTHLIEARGSVVSRETLLRLVWGIPSPIKSRRVDITISRLRSKLGAVIISEHDGYKI